MRIFNQPFDGSLGDRLINFLDSSDYKLVNIIVAFAKNSGVLRIKDALDQSIFLLGLILGEHLMKRFPHCFFMLIHCMLCIRNVHKHSTQKFMILWETKKLLLLSALTI